MVRKLKWGFSFSSELILVDFDNNVMMSMRPEDALKFANELLEIYNDWENFDWSEPEDE